MIDCTWLVWAINLLQEKRLPEGETRQLEEAIPGVFLTRKAEIKGPIILNGNPAIPAKLVYTFVVAGEDMDHFFIRVDHDKLNQLREECGFEILDGALDNKINPREIKLPG